MKEELVKAIREDNPKIAMSNFDYAGNMTEAILLGNVAMRRRRKVHLGRRKDENQPTRYRQIDQ